MKKRVSIKTKVEIGFDSVYLVSALVIGCYLLAKSGTDLGWRWGIMALVLAGGDGFHLVPRMISSYYGEERPCVKALGIGKLVTSITMAIFYIILWHNGLLLLGMELPVLTGIIYGLVVLRVFLCLLPHNKWAEGGKESAIGIIRNIPFFVQGILVTWVYARNVGAQVSTAAVDSVWIAILVSFACYIPVVLWVHKNPKLGMLMIPKTCAYLWIVCVGLFL